MRDTPVHAIAVSSVLSRGKYVTELQSLVAAPSEAWTDGVVLVPLSVWRELTARPEGDDGDEVRP